MSNNRKNKALAQERSRNSQQATWHPGGITIDDSPEGGFGRNIIASHLAITIRHSKSFIFDRFSEYLQRSKSLDYRSL